jgi:fatty-acid desaturase
VRHQWWEADPIFAFIELLESVGLATHVVRPRAERIKKSTSHVPGADPQS